MHLAEIGQWTRTISAKPLLSTHPGMAIKPLGIAVAVIALSDCAHLQTRPSVSTRTRFGEFISPKTLRMAPERNQMVILGGPIEQDPPAYPERMVGKDIARREVCLAIAINRKGIVYQSHPLYGMLSCPDNAAAVEPAFVKAAQADVLHWRFHPTVLCTFPKGVDASTKDDYRALEGGKAKPIPIMLAFDVTFTEVRGTAAVHMGRMHE